MTEVPYTGVTMTTAHGKTTTLGYGLSSHFSFGLDFKL